MSEYIVRFFAGGAVVSIFAMIGDVLRPKSFAGLLGAAPSVALVSLALAISMHGPDYASSLATSMIAGAIALFSFSLVTCYLLKRAQMSALSATLFACPIWLVVSIGLYTLVS
jgi:hypothetical protein